mgnify:CR=1 FL=1
MREGGWETVEAGVRMEPSAVGVESRVRIHRLRRADGEYRWVLGRRDTKPEFGFVTH